VGPNAKYIETLSDEKLLNEFDFILKKFLGHIYDIPTPQAILRYVIVKFSLKLIILIKLKLIITYRSKWFSDKHTRGSYSFRSINTERLNILSKDLADPIKTINNKPVI
jgi:hypothetical protein